MSFLFLNSYYIGQILNTSAILMIAGCGSSIANKSGNMNLGGEGQIYLGGFITCLVLTQETKMPSAVVMLLAFLGAVLSCGFLTLISAFLKEKRDAKILLTTFLASAAIIPLIDSFIIISKNKTESNLLALPFIAQKYRIPQLVPPSPLNVSFFIAILICLTVYAFFKYTYAGKKIEIWGKAPQFASYAGFSTNENSYISITLSGALHGLAGFFAVTGTYYTCHQGFYSGMGWNALTASLIAGSNSIILIPVTLFLSWLYSTADRIALLLNLNFDISSILQGIILLLIALLSNLKFKKSA